MAAKKGGCAIVTGSNQGIGLEIARGLARYMPTVMTSRDTARGREAMEKLLAEEPGLDLAMQQLDITDDDSVDRFVAWTESHYDGVAVLVNNAGIAFKARDPTPFEGQTEPTLNTNCSKTFQFTDKMIPSVLKGSQDGITGKIIFVASQAGTSALSGCTPPLQREWTDGSLTVDGVLSLLDKFKSGVSRGTYRADGWPQWNYGVSKLGVIAAAKAYHRALNDQGVVVTSYCPGHCATNMSSYSGRTAAKGAETAIWLALSDHSEAVPGGFYYDKQLIM